MTPPAIDSETHRLVAQRLNHYAISGPMQTQLVYVISTDKHS